MDDRYLESIPAAHRIPRVSEIDAETFHEAFYKPARPVILENAMAGWRCKKRWTLPYLREALRGYGHTFQYEEKARMKMPLGEYLDHAFGLNGGEASRLPAPPSKTERIPYVRHFGPLDEIEPGELAEEYELRSLFPGAAGFRFSSFFFFGAAGTKTNCHYDWTHNFVGVIHGEKHVTLLPPRAEIDMAVDDDLRAEMARGSCDFFADPADLQLRARREGEPGGLMMHEHPVFKRCKEVYYGPLRAGELVFFPSYWYHYFHNVEPTVSVGTQTCPR